MTVTVRRGPRIVTDALLRRWPLPPIDGTYGKEGRGTVLVVGGSEQMPGAVVLAALGALRAGAGTLQIATGRGAARSIASLVPEARVVGLREARGGEIARTACGVLAEETARCDALLVGPGMRDPRASVDLLRRCILRRHGAALVVDAAALAIFEGKKPPPRRHAAGIVVTPHAGEMARMWGIDRDEVVARPLEIARDAAAKLGVVVALKGEHTYVVAPDGTAFRNVAGNVGLGTSGSGDTLSGIVAGLAARGATPLQAAVWGVYVHAKAGDALTRKIGPIGYLARELLGEIPRLVGALGRRR